MFAVTITIRDRVRENILITCTLAGVRSLGFGYNRYSGPGPLFKFNNTIQDVRYISLYPSNI